MVMFVALVVVMEYLSVLSFDFFFPRCFPLFPTSSFHSLFNPFFINFPLWLFLISQTSINSSTSSFSSFLIFFFLYQLSSPVASPLFSQPLHKLQISLPDFHLSFLLPFLATLSSLAFSSAGLLGLSPLVTSLARNNDIILARWLYVRLEYFSAP